MNTMTEKPKKMNIGSRVTVFSLARGKLVSGAMVGLTTAVLLAAALSEYATASGPTAQAVEGPITLPEAIEISLANNPELAAQRFGVDAASAKSDVAVGARLPEVRLRGDYSFYRDPRLIKPRRPGTYNALSFTDRLLSGDFIVRMPLYTGGRLKNQVVRADLIAQARWEKLLYSRTELMFNVSSVFYAMLGQREVINSLRFSQKALEQHRKKTEELLNAQKAAKVDLLRTEVRLADLQQQQLRERNLLDIQGYLLASLLGLGGEDRPLDVKGHLTLPVVPADVDHGLAIAFANRQDYESLKSQVLAQQKQIAIAKSEGLPELWFRGSYGDRWATDSSKHNEVGELGIVFDAPLYKGGRVRARVRQENCELAASRQRLRKLELKIQLEVQTATSNIKFTRARVDATRKAIEQAIESLRIETEKYDVGKGAIVDVLDAQSALLNTQTYYYRALAEYNTALAEFRVAVGERQ